MKLLMITGLGSARDLASGKRGAFYNTLEEFSKYWDRIDIICPKPVISKKQLVNSKSSYQLPVTNYFGNVYIHISPWPLVFHPFWFLKKSLEIYREQKFDLMTVHEFPPFYNGLGAKLLEKLVKVPYVLEIFHIPGHPKAAGVKEVIYKKLMQFFIRYDASRARAVRIMNQEVGRFLENAGVPKEKLILIPAVYVDSDIFKPLNLPKEYDLIFIGRLESNKGIDLFLEAARLLITNYRLPVKCLIVGDGPERQKIEKQITDHNLPVTLFGFAKDQREIAGLLNKSKILVMPSYNEGGPRVVAEALACGVPVLATPVGVVPDLLKNPPDGGQAVLGGEIIDWNADDIAKKAEKILRNYEIYRNSGLEIAKQFEKKTAIKNYADKLKNLSTV